MYVAIIDVWNAWLFLWSYFTCCSWQEEICLVADGRHSQDSMVSSAQKGPALNMLRSEPVWSQSSYLFPALRQRYPMHSTCASMMCDPDLRIMWCLNPSRPGIAKAQHILCSALLDSVNHGCTDSCECRPTCRSLLTAASRSLLITQEGRKDETDLSFLGSSLSALWGSWSAFQTWKGSDGGEDCQCRVWDLFGSEEVHKNLLEILS